ncbi:hypothetical protein FRB94_006941 [Tulasnella sp. JGI-2019a]|nr:hypothetical protein FRB94_006941 [Tulasnella sp. JGI-2019a]KAG9031267.1 hypothetical protein FRB95_002907 [Tulasnella sp. JGI-2019a]
MGLGKALLKEQWTCRQALLHKRERCWRALIKPPPNAPYNIALSDSTWSYMGLAEVVAANCLPTFSFDELLAVVLPYGVEMNWDKRYIHAHLHRLPPYQQGTSEQLRGRPSMVEEDAMGDANVCEGHTLELSPHPHPRRRVEYGPLQPNLNHLMADRGSVRTHSHRLPPYKQGAS